ncbi:MAG: type IV pilus assembly protein PilM [Candidatus Omnitrophica bacterium]|nr:type IV pilus assembly protein PilM [Candidatus Omnitrophota bacterium]
MNIFSKIKLPRTKDKFSIGLDIGTQSIKCVRLKINNIIELVNFDLEEGQLDPTDVLKKIRHVQDADLVNLSFCGTSTVIRYVNFMRMSKTELRQALKFEAQKYIPFSLNEVYLDAEILKNDLPENKMLVLIAAIKKELMQQRFRILENAGLRPNIIDIDSLALVNSFNFNYPRVDVPEDKSICLLNIGASVSNVNILDNGIPRLSRDIHCGGANFTKKLMDIFEIDFKQAEEQKINPAEDKADKVKAGIESVLTSLATEIRTSFDYYESQNTSSVVKIFLSGGGSKINGLIQMLSACLGIPVEPWDPFKQIKISDKIDMQKLNDFSAQFNIAVGLALR